jgi:addiction module HigA family antidote
MARTPKPPHPGEVLRECLPEGFTVTQAAAALHVARATLSKVLNGRAAVSAPMALRLAQWLGTSPDVWMGMQSQFDLWRASKRRLPAIKPLSQPTAPATAPAAPDRAPTAAP